MHGDTQAVFEFEPPESLLKETADVDPMSTTLASGNTSVKDELQSRPHLKRANTKRKGSMVSVTGITEHLSEFLHERGADNIADRLEALESSTERIEKLLRKISQDMGDDDGENDDGPHIHRREDTNAIEDGDSD